MISVTLFSDGRAKKSFESLHFRAYLQGSLMTNSWHVPDPILFHPLFGISRASDNENYAKITHTVSYFIYKAIYLTIYSIIQ